jgi:hypothetical protein
VLFQVLFHAAANLSWQLYPVHGSTFAPALSGPLRVIVAVGFLMAPRRPRFWSTGGHHACSESMSAGQARTDDPASSFSGEP